MNIIIAARHCEIPDELRTRATDLVTWASKMVRRPQPAEITFDEAHKRTVEVVLHLPRNQVRVAKSEASSCQAALDSAVEKLKHQFDKDDSSKVLRRRNGRGEPNLKE